MADSRALNELLPFMQEFLPPGVQLRSSLQAPGSFHEFLGRFGEVELPEILGSRLDKMLPGVLKNLSDDQLKILGILSQGDGGQYPFEGPRHKLEESLFKTLRFSTVGHAPEV